MNPSFKLFRLQQIDSQHDKAQDRLQEIAIILKQDEELRRAETRVRKTQIQLEAVRKALRQAEENVRGQRLKIEQTESTLYGGKVRNPKELQDLQNESAALKRYLEVLEERQLEAMFTVDESEAAYESAQKNLERVEESRAEQHRELMDERRQLQAESARLEEERHATTRTIENEHLRLYEELRPRRRGIAVAKVSDRACAACGTTLNAALLHQARSPSKITLCSSCGRILYGG